MFLLTKCINYIKIRPVDVVRGLGRCVCYNADLLCVGVCRQSSCELVIEHPTQGNFAVVCHWNLPYKRMWLSYIQFQKTTKIFC